VLLSVLPAAAGRRSPRTQVITGRGGGGPSHFVNSSRRNRRAGPLTVSEESGRNELDVFGLLWGVMGVFSLRLARSPALKRRSFGLTPKLTTLTGT
jgi:hypothetical protein